MFTGIIEEIGVVSEININAQASKLRVSCNLILEDVKLGDSIAVNGVCLTVTEISSNSFTADLSEETLKISILKNLKIGDFVNLERAMKANGRFGGHVVSGHIDGVGKIKNIEKKGDFYDLKLELESNLIRYTIKKGSVTVNGISLTIADINKNVINLAIIPHTFNNTNLQRLKQNDFVNIEVDMIAKYIEKFLSPSDNKSKISLEFLQEHGF